MTSGKVEVGQVWLPKPHTGPGAELLRIVCRYPFHTHEREVLWIVEHMDYVQKLERLPEESLLVGWNLSHQQPKEHDA